MKFSAIKIALLAFASLAVGTQAQKGQKKCGNCVKDCIDEDSTLADKKKDFIDTCDADEKCIIDCDSTDCVAACDGKKKCVKKCKKTQKKCEKKKVKKEKVCKNKCVMGLMKADTAYQELLAEVKAACEANDCKIEPECDVSDCECDCAEAEDPKTCKKECMKCKDPLMKACHSTCVNDAPEGGRCGCGCTSCTCDCKKNDDECKETCKTCKGTLKTCMGTCFEEDPTAKECVSGCSCDYPFKKGKKGKGKGGGPKFL